MEDIDFDLTKNRVLKCPSNCYEKVSSHYKYGNLNKYDGSDKNQQNLESISLVETTDEDCDKDCGNKSGSMDSLASIQQIDSILKFDENNS